MLGLTMASPSIGGTRLKCSTSDVRGSVSTGGGDGFPSFLPKEVCKIRDPFARILAQRIERLPVQIGFSESCIMSSCVKPQVQRETNPVVLLHSFDSSCLEWRCVYPLLEDAGLEVWAVDILGWGFSDLERLPPCNSASKRHHLYQLWKSHIKRRMVLVGPSLGAAVAIDFVINHPEAVEKLILINPNVYANGTGLLSKLPERMAYAMVSLLKSVPLRLCAKLLFLERIPFTTSLDWTNVGRLHCLLPWWEDATVNYMRSGGYNVIPLVKQVKHKALIIRGDCDRIVSNELVARVLCELQDAIMRKIPRCGHLPHVEKPHTVAKLIADFALGDSSY